MGFSFGGLIAGAMKGVGEGMTTVAKGELENQQKLDYQKEILRLTEEKDLRVDETKRDRDIRDIGRTTEATAKAKLAAAPIDAETAATRAATEATKRGELRVPQLEAGNKVAGEVAAADAQLEQDLPGKTAQLKRKEFDANKDLKRDEATETGGNEARKQVGKTGVQGFTASVAAEDVAKSAGERGVAEVREAGRASRTTTLRDMTDSLLLREAETLRKSADSARGEARNTYATRLNEVMDEIQRRRQERGAAPAASAASAPRSSASAPARPPISNFQLNR